MDIADKIRHNALKTMKFTKAGEIVTVQEARQEIRAVATHLKNEKGTS